MGWIDQIEDGQCDGHMMWQAGQDDYVPLLVDELSSVRKAQDTSLRPIWNVCGWFGWWVSSGR